MPCHKPLLYAWAKLCNFCAIFLDAILDRAMCLWFYYFETNIIGTFWASASGLIPAYNDIFGTFWASASGLIPAYNDMSESVASGKYFFGRFFVINSSERFFWEITCGLPSEGFIPQPLPRPEHDGYLLMMFIIWWWWRLWWWLWWWYDGDYDDENLGAFSRRTYSTV